AGAVVAVVMFSGCGDDGMSGESSGVNDFLSRFSESSGGGGEREEYKLTTTVDPAGSGIITRTPNLQNISHSTPVSVTVTVPDGQKFRWWNVTPAGVSIGDSTRTIINFIMPASDVTLIANFYDSFKDSRDGKTYVTVRIGNLTWMAQNLNYATSDSWCYGDDPSNCTKYGRLYTWDAAMSACPAGWRLPTREDWNNLVQAVGGSSMAGTRLKARAPDWDGTDDYEFSALPAGGRDTYGTFYGAGAYGIWWSATENGSGNAYLRDVISNNARVNENNYAKGYGFSARCVR
ncbi:MAG: hypothetical protein FWB85_10285, partial [Chitinispirillia bacterium]|nr:hypothetical protein [Chitinispirillia bacterium]